MMDATCCVSQCKSKNTKDITLFKFPRDESLRDKWAKKLKLDGGTNDYLYVCSLHFLPKDFYTTSYSSNRLRLKRGVIPSVKIQHNPSPKHRGRRTLKFKGRIDDSKKKKIVKRLANHSPSINVTPAKESQSKLSESLCAQGTDSNEINQGTKLSLNDANSSNTNSTIERKTRQKSSSKNITEVIDLISDKEDTESAPETNDHKKNQRKKTNTFKGFEFVDVKKSLATTYEVPLPPVLRPSRLKPNILRRPVETRSFQPKNIIEPIKPGINSSLHMDFTEATHQTILSPFGDKSESIPVETSSSSFRNVKEQISRTKTVGTQTMSITSTNTIAENASQQVSFVKVIEYLRKNLVGNTLKVNGSTFKIDECSITFKNKDKPSDVSMLVVDSDKLISSGTFLLSSLLEGCEFEGVSKLAEEIQPALKKDHAISKGSVVAENVQSLPKRDEITMASEPAEQLQPSTKKDSSSKSQCVQPVEHCDLVMKDIPSTIEKKQTENESAGLFANYSLNNCLKDIFHTEAKVILNKLPENLVRAIKNGDNVKVDTEEFIRKGVLYRRYIVKATPRLPPPSIRNMPLQVVGLIAKSTPGKVSSNMPLFLNASGQILRGVGAEMPQKDLTGLPLPDINITDEPLRTSVSKNDVSDLSLSTNIPSKVLPSVPFNASLPKKDLQDVPVSSSAQMKNLPVIPLSSSTPNKSISGIPASTSAPNESVPGIPASTSEPNKSLLRRPVRILPKTSLATSTPVICTTCFAILPSLAYLNEHKKIHVATKKDDSKSIVDSKKMNSKTELMVPQNQKKPELFIESDIEISQSKELEQKTLNENINNISIVEKQPINCTADEEKYYVCNVCDKSFKFHYSLSYHKTLMHGRDFKSVPDNVMENVPSNEEMCPECPQSFKTTNDFEKHLLDCHAIVLKKSVYNCEKCPKEFITFRSLGYHQEKVHNAIVNTNVLVKWKCRFCNKLFGFDYKFKTIHTKECIMNMKKEKEEILKSSMNSKQSDSNHFHEKLLESVNHDLEHDINNISPNSDSKKRKYENEDIEEKRMKTTENCNQIFQKLETLLGSIDGPNDITIVNMDEV